MANRLQGAVSPYLRAHAENPVDWYPWGPEAFAAARERDVPVLVSIGYATCHWCHVMARQSFSDPVVAAQLNRDFVAVKVDREEHPGVDGSYLAAASAFTRELGWPLTVFTTPEGRTFYAGTYFPPKSVGATPAFSEVLAAVAEAWRSRRGELLAMGDEVAKALAGAASATAGGALPSDAELHAAARSLAADEDREYGGFGPAPKFPVPTVLGFLGELPGEARALSDRTLQRMAASPLFDPVDGGFFRYATKRDWSEPHYERMLPDNAQLLGLAVAATRQPDALGWAAPLASDLARFLTTTMALPGGGFASAQDSESVLDGRRNEGGYYRLDAEARAAVSPPALDAKLLSGWNGLTIGALSAFAERGLEESAAAAALAAARTAAAVVLERHLVDGMLRRASLDGVVSEAPATLEDVGMLAGGLIRLALASGEAGWASRARELIDRALHDAEPHDAETGGEAARGIPFAPPVLDPTLDALGLALPDDPAEGAAPSGLTSCADAALLLAQLGAGEHYREAAERAMASVAGIAPGRPIAFGGALAVMARLRAAEVQLVVVAPADEASEALIEEARRQPAAIRAVVTPGQAQEFAAAGFELFAAREALDGRATAYRCEHFVCALPVHEPGALAALVSPTIEE
ncbi:thioredoxin domain-containing protein [Agromyces soli]|uniref:DUF255 domain-containing protein n=1 Tax=Agromyces soli TaxID=659012 RepID=A0ABY4ATN3_9MICO|nr:DUF255 domain-containing protein [Agromyces soli]UOE26189.1 DUF255 domain-containing protein [Agromyces soli]